MLKIFLILVLSVLFLVIPACTGNDTPSVTDDIENGVNDAINGTENMAEDMLNGAENMADDMTEGTEDMTGGADRSMETKTNDTSVTGNPSVNNMQ